MEADREDIPSDAVWMTVAELARVKGVKRQSLSERIDRIERDGAVVTKRNGRSRLVDVAAYDRAVGQIGDAFREQATATRMNDGGSASPKLRDAQTDKLNYEARLKALDLAERTGKLVPRMGEKGVETALVKITGVLLQIFGNPMEWTAELMDAARKGEPELRRLLRSKIRDQRSLASQELLKLAGAAEAEDAATGVYIDIDFED